MGPSPDPLTQNLHFSQDRYERHSGADRVLGESPYASQLQPLKKQGEKKKNQGGQFCSICPPPALWLFFRLCKLQWVYSRRNLMSLQDWHSFYKPLVHVKSRLLNSTLMLLPLDRSQPSLWGQQDHSMQDGRIGEEVGCTCLLHDMESGGSCPWTMEIHFAKPLPLSPASLVPQKRQKKDEKQKWQLKSTAIRGHSLQKK